MPFPRRSNTINYHRMQKPQCASTRRRYFLESNDICIKYCYAPCARTSGERFLGTIVAMWALKRAGGGLSEMSVAIRPTIGAPLVSVNVGELTSSTHFGEYGREEDGPRLLLDPGP